MTDYFDVALIPEGAKEYFEANRKVLVVEDDKLMGQVVAEILDDVGFEVVSAANSWTALDILQQRPIDFIILDILLPEMDGFDFYTRLQANPELKNIATMIVSAWSDEHNREQAAKMGIKQFLPKPFTEDELLNTILTLLVDSSRSGD